MSDVTLAAAIERAKGAATVLNPNDPNEMRKLGCYCGELVATMAGAGIGTLDALRDEMWAAVRAVWAERWR